jgi:predicted RNA binding protein YcfA (HicA-like mRNA interferase family)
MARLLSSAEIVHLLLAHGFAFVSQKGSHAKYRDAQGRTVIVPAGRREMPRGTLASIIRQSGLSRELFS